MAKKTEAEKVSGIDTQIDIHDADKSIMVNASTQIVVYSVLFIIFLILRNKFRLIFSPNPRKKKIHPAYNHTGILNWILPIYRTTDIEMININGLDSYVMLSLFKMIATIFFYMIIFVTLPLCGLYAFGAFNSEEIYFSLCYRNKDEYYVKLCSFVVVFIITTIVILVLYSYAKSFISLRQAYIRNPATMHPIEYMKKHSVEYVNAPSKSVLLTRLPTYLESSLDLSSYVSALGLGEQKNAMIVRDTRRYNKLLSRKKKIVIRLENEIYAIYRQRTQTELSEKEAGGNVNDGSAGSASTMELEEEKNSKIMPIEKKVHLLKALFNDKKYDKLQGILSELKKNHDDITEELKKLNEDTTIEKNIVEIIQDELYDRDYSDKENLKGDDSFKSAEDKEGNGRSSSSGDKSKENRDDDLVKDDKGKDNNERSGEENDVEKGGDETVVKDENRDKENDEEKNKENDEEKNKENDEEKNKENDEEKNKDNDEENQGSEKNENNLGSPTNSVNSETYHACLRNAVFRSSFNLEIPYKTRAGIVSFKHQRSASILCQSLISSKMFSCIAEPAPAPNDIKYDNINKSPFIANMQRLLCSFLFVLFTLMFFYAVGLIASFCNLKYLEGKFTWLADLLKEHANWRATLNGILSPLAYNILMTIGPIFIRLIITLESNYSGTADQVSLMNRYSIFLFLNGFLSFVTTYSVHQLSGLDEVKKVLEGLQTGLLKTSVFFMNALIQKALVGQVLILLQVGPLISKAFAYMFSNKTLRSKKQLEKSISLDFGTVYPNMLLIFAICLVYSILTPIILVVGFVFYISCFVVFKNEFIYCVKNETETGGVHFNFAATYIIYILIFFQTSTAVQYLTSHNMYLSLCLFVLAVLTFFLKNAFLKSFQRACAFYPLSLQEEHYIDSFTRTLLLSRVRFIKKWTQQTSDEMVELRKIGYVDAECAMEYERPTDKEGIYLDTEVFVELEKIYG
ncbi:hypothetical protein VCUG_01679 [Vavraia culicis subsp. floridensis]|uniref:CSC1/OSCA1-like 7TM region domain-containing protein n=1 Tax=Vavraia culicis (isolate floridensis) TaxID=948595 RepID=L2GUQ7_VAVCU|nr:uncharacterized protein VCUG_01679 [Vavraia culicis subsp. floridensis]ELA46835.1 hypothetical protein VCUG_01679 [Vavraia culicis subsp. floridensis]